MAANEIEKIDDNKVVSVLPSNNEIKPIEIRSAFDIDPRQFKAGLARRGKNRDALMKWLEEALVEGVDYGRIHVVKKDKCPAGNNCTNKYHFSKPSLWKSGAEKISGMLGLRATWPNIDAELEHVRDGKPVILLKCQLVGLSGSIVSEGVGARNIGQDGGDPNKALKMAKKSSLIDSVLNAGGLSEAFTQDIEDMPPEGFSDDARPDPYQSGQTRIDSAFGGVNKPVETHCPIGQFKGKPWAEVDDGYLNWIIINIDDKPDLVAAAKREIGGRSVETQAATVLRRDTATAAPMKKLADYAREVTVAKHIDELIAIRDDLPTEYEPALRTFMVTREAELTK